MFTSGCICASCGLWMKYMKSDILWHWVTANLEFGFFFIIIVPVTECVATIYSDYTDWVEHAWCSVI